MLSSIIAKVEKEQNKIFAERAITALRTAMKEVGYLKGKMRPELCRNGIEHLIGMLHGYL